MDRLREIAALDPVADAQRIYRLSAGFEFPFDYRRSLELALFRTYCVPSISALLDRTGEFATRPQTTAVRAALRARSGVVRLLPPRRRSKLTRESRNRTYPGYPERWDVADLGAP